MATDHSHPEESLPVTFRDAVRYKPRTYLGGTDSSAVSFLVFEVVSGSLTKWFKAIRVTVMSDRQIRFACAGVSPEALPGSDPAIALFELCDGTKSASFLIRDNNYLPVLNALSTQFEVDVHHAGVARHQVFQKGLPDSEPTSKKSKAAKADECTITATLDPEMFETAWFQHDRLAIEVASLVTNFPDLTILLEDDRGA